MPAQFSRFRIEGLHHRRTYDVPIVDNRLIIVGENGSGKSTVASIIYSFLTSHWERLASYDFESVVATIDGKDLALNHGELSSNSPTGMLHEDLPVSLGLRGVDAFINTALSQYALDDLINDRESIRYLANEIGVPSPLLIDRITKIRKQELKSPSRLRQISDAVKSSTLGQILYLPTYRRIEQYLRAIFPGSSREIRELRERLTRRPPRQGYVELVEFGMEDVEAIIHSKLNQIKDAVRSGLTKLMGTYLGDVIRGDHHSVDPTTILGLDVQTIDAIFSRIDEEIMPIQEQGKLREIIKKIQEEQIVQSEERVVAHFLTRLVELYKVQQESENDVRDFVSVCNEYLVGKEMAYDRLAFDISIHTISAHASIDNGNDRVELRMLSSGEKQIVSLFSHVYLSSESGYFVIIDEPELSLSVPWQKRFLPDLLATNRCWGLIAVTHSPFIFDNELDPYTHSIDEFMEVTNHVAR